jgi:hypothetical protein
MFGGKINKNQCMDNNNNYYYYYYYYQQWVIPKE